MNRRHFLGQVVLGSAAVASLTRSSSAATQSTEGLSVNFVGMMYYLNRSDQSLLVAVPGTHRLGLYEHTSFLMARAGSPIAAALGLTPMPGVVAGAFDMRLANEPAGAFVFRCLDGIDIDIEPHDRSTQVVHRATHLAQLDRIAPGKKVRGDLRRWARATVAVRGGQLDNAAAHPDAGKIWSFGSHQQPLTDATTYRIAGATVRLSSGPQVRSFSASGSNPGELWVVSAAGPRTEPIDPKRLEHSHLLFEFLENATAVVATCDEAEGRITLPTELPCAATAVASTRGGYTAAAPPYVDLCYGGGGCDDCN